MSMSEVTYGGGGIRYPHIEVTLSATDGNAYNIINAVRAGLGEHGVHAVEVEQFMAEAMSGDYDNLIQTVLRWVEVT